MFPGHTFERSACGYPLRSAGTRNSSKLRSENPSPTRVVYLLSDHWTPRQSEGKSIPIRAPYRLSQRLKKDDESTAQTQTDEAAIRSPRLTLSRLHAINAQQASLSLEIRRGLGGVEHTDWTTSSDNRESWAESSADWTRALTTAGAGRSRADEVAREPRLRAS